MRKEDGRLLKNEGTGQSDIPPRTLLKVGELLKSGGGGAELPWRQELDKGNLDEGCSCKMYLSFTVGGGGGIRKSMGGEEVFMEAGKGCGW